jgi:hypothetical protein
LPELITTRKNGKIFEKSLLGTENDKHDNHEIIKIKVQKKILKKGESQGCYIFYMDGQIHIYLSVKAELVEVAMYALQCWQCRG